MKPKIAFIFLTLLGIAVGKPKLILHPESGQEPIAISGDNECNSGALFSEAIEFSCACVTGLWAFYVAECEKAYALIGASNGQCVTLNNPIRKVNLLSPSDDIESATASSAIVFDRRMVSIGMKFVSVPGAFRSSNFVSAGFPIVVTSGKQSWRIPSKRLCLKPPSYKGITNRTLFCLFNHEVTEEYRMDAAGCFQHDRLIKPMTCVPYLEDEDINDGDPRSCRKRRTRREPQQQGRVFLDAVEGLKENTSAPQAPSGGNGTGNSSGTNDEDENHDLAVNIEHSIMNSELWNYMTLRAKETLGIFKSKSSRLSRNRYSPSLVFLQMAKRIQQKACPDHYVRDEHYDVAVGAFTSIQQNHFRYSDPFVDYETSTRIESALTACLNNITEYPFIERVNKGQEEIQCEGMPTITHGSYKMFDEILDFNVRYDLAARNNEPIVETVWKVFVHAHSACFNFFEKHFNDHHRFTTIMLPLFTNEISDIWFSVPELKPDIYTGFLGDAIDLMDSVSYCGIFSRLESDYPWELPRPKRDNARRKRDIGGGVFHECVDEMDAWNVCPKDSYKDITKNHIYHQTSDEIIPKDISVNDL